MQYDISPSPTIGRRGFLKAAGGTAILAALPRALSAATAAASGPVVIAFVGCAHIHTPGFIKLLNGDRPLVRVKLVWDHEAVRGSQARR